MAKVILVPTSHVARQSIGKVRETIEREKPDCVAVELDINRYSAMVGENQSSSLEALRTLGIITFTFYWILNRLQSWLGKRMGILPGSEMLQAVDAAKMGGARVAFIDRDIRATLIGIREISRREKLKLIYLIFRGLTADYLMLKTGSRGEKVDLNRLPPKDMIKQAMQVMKKEFPQLYAVLVDERDMHMANAVKSLSGRFEKIVVVAGAGHAEGLKKYLGL
jgi:pheromone shutdown-related protein TraB